VNVQNPISTTSKTMYPFGIVGGNFIRAKDYTGFFTDYSASVVGIGGAYVFWPDGANATSITFNLTDFVSDISSENPKVEVSAILDWYFMIPDENDPSTSWDKQFDGFKTELGKVFNGKNEFNQAIKDVENVFKQVMQKTELIDDL
jgi:hypothetical protein